MKKILLWAGLITGSLISTAQAVTVEDLSRHSDYGNVKISPSGKYLAVTINNKGRKGLAILETDSLKLTCAKKPDGDVDVMDFYWVSDKRVLAQVAHPSGSLEVSKNQGEYYAINYDCSKERVVAEGFNKGGKILSASVLSLIDPMVDDPKYALFSKNIYGTGKPAPTSLVKVNLFSGRDTKVVGGPGPHSSFIVDKNGHPAYASYTDDKLVRHLYRYEAGTKKWSKFSTDDSENLFPQGFAENESKLIMTRKVPGKPNEVVALDLNTKTETKLVQSEFADPTYFLYNPNGEIYGARLDEDYPSYVFFNQQEKESQLHKALQGAFKGKNVNFTSWTQDGSKVVVFARSSRDPGTFFLFDTKTMQAKQLLKPASWLKPKELAPKQPFRIKSHDGLVLNGYLTTPLGKETNLPTVIMPHGGPHARDYGGFDKWVQVLANAGYAVVQVNFRGSTGYGKSFEEAGFKEWGTGMQQDIISAAKYAIQDGVADPDRVCIAGASYGGYSAVQAAIVEPDLFKCSIAYVGVFDLEMLFTWGDIRRRKAGISYLERTLGTDAELHKAQSPVHHVDKLKAPVFIIHGKEDPRAPVEHAEALRKELDKHNHPYEWMVKEKEGHGFYNEDNILEGYQAMLKFLDKHIGH